MTTLTTASAAAEIAAHISTFRNEASASRARGGSCAVDLCTVAGGGVDGYYEHGPQVWDHCAGALIALEAGALFALVPVPDTPDPLIVAAGPALFDELTALLSRYY